MDFDHDATPYWSLNQTSPVPDRIMATLLNLSVSETAHFVLRTWEPGTVVHLGDPFGLVLSWLWTTDPDRAVLLFAEIVTQIRHGDQESTLAITMDAILDGLSLAVQGIDDDTFNALIDRCRNEAPAMIGRNPNKTS